jgi:hypothetical protein
MPADRQREKCAHLGQLEQQTADTAQRIAAARVQVQYYLAMADHCEWAGRLSPGYWGIYLTKLATSWRAEAFREYEQGLHHREGSNHSRQIS